ncbi:hypothetical protein [Opitutus sp. ER46]|uniref:hypothetical protein n=1 Tax=Opitutus sp. ER46 TaxID=2161864 RepID=UPI000D3262A3|nr:hypothetical protein [Opitutus sp. ER46]PTY01233.1 hypothetical protein DB354_00330 [Opitutus sp. ER46]
MKKILGSLILVIALIASASAQGIPMIRRGEVLRWTIEGGQSGLMKVTAVDGALFEIEQTNEHNRSVGAVRMFGAVIDNGRKVILLNVGQWKEVWEGELLHDKIVGTLSAGTAHSNFQILPAAHREAGPAPFITGRTLRWETNALGGQGGTLFVTRTEGPWFYLEQSNSKNPNAGVVRLEGEIKEGRIYIYNRKWNETWVGVVRRGVVVGKVNGQAEFRIFE